MPEIDNEMSLTAIGSYLHPIEAELLADRCREEGIPAKVVGDGLSTDLSYLGTAVGGTRVLVPKSSAQRASELFEEHQREHAGESGDAFPSDFDFGDSEPESVAEDQDDSGVEINEKAMKRAFNAAIFGLFFAPFFVGAYSMWLIFRHSLWAGQNATDWRLPASLACNLFSFWVGKLFWFSWASEFTQGQPVL